MLHVFYQHEMQVGNCLDFILNAFYQHEMHAGVVSCMFYKRFWIDRVSLGYSIPNHKYVAWTVSPKFIARHSAVIAMRRGRLYARDNKACLDCKQKIPHTIHHWRQWRTFLILIIWSPTRRMQANALCSNDILIHQAQNFLPGSRALSLFPGLDKCATDKQFSVEDRWAMRVQMCYWQAV